MLDTWLIWKGWHLTVLDLTVLKRRIKVQKIVYIVPKILHYVLLRQLSVHIRMLAEIGALVRVLFLSQRYFGWTLAFWLWPNLFRAHRLHWLFDIWIEFIPVSSRFNSWIPLSTIKLLLVFLSVVASWWHPLLLTGSSNFQIEHWYRWLQTLCWSVLILVFLVWWKSKFLCQWHPYTLLISRHWHIGRPTNLPFLLFDLLLSGLDLLNNRLKTGIDHHFQYIKFSN